jgi:hypothetical protein
MRHNYTQNRRYEVQAHYEINEPELFVGTSAQKRLNHRIDRERCMVNIVAPSKVDDAPEHKGDSDAAESFSQKNPDGLINFGGLKQQRTAKHNEEGNAHDDQ